MKTKRRHELQTNLLADWIGKQTEALKPYANHIIVIAIVIVVVIGFFVAMSGDTPGASQAWQAYFAASGDEELDMLKNVSKSHPNTDASLWAKLREGDIQMSEGTNLLYTDTREAGIESIENARKAYRTILSKSNVPVMLQRRAMFALAQCMETLSIVEEDPEDIVAALEEAKDKYSEIADKWATTAIGKAADENAKRLEDPATVEFYKFFAAYEPVDPSAPPEDPVDPLAEFPDLPTRPDLSFPGEETLDTAANNDFEIPLAKPTNKGDGESDDSSDDSTDDDKKSTDKKSSEEDDKKKSND